MTQPAERKNNESASTYLDTGFRNLAQYNNNNFYSGRGKLWRILWYLTSVVLFESSILPISAPKRTILRWFGAKIGSGVVIKPRVQIKFPWRLQIGNNTWIGERVWIDNLAEVQIGANVCVSQGVYLCTGSHDHRKPTFDLITRPITLEDGSWICAKSILLPGVTIHTGAIVGAGCVIPKDIAPHEIVTYPHTQR